MNRKIGVSMYIQVGNNDIYETKQYKVEDIKSILIGMGGLRKNIELGAKHQSTGVDIDDR